jgi:hypothetical protein
MNGFFDGAIVMSAAVVALLYFKAWNKTHDRLFGFFAGAFVLMMIERIILRLLGAPMEYLPYIYCLRLLAFSLIAIGILQKNLTREQ